MNPTVADARRVFEAWRARRARPDACRLTAERKAMLKARMRLGYSADDLILIVTYIYEADTDDARWMRGANPRRRKYLDLENILTRKRLAERLEAATVWNDEKDIVEWTYEMVVPEPQEATDGAGGSSATRTTPNPTADATRPATTGRRRWSDIMGRNDR